ncbi:hypothetical protein DFH07DRAFT_784364 [Mycena maculata]|uniref:Uncharacterized protein n=1 Tax=Mycena maculata TaxID=230809 RepID=A0AAD7MJU7_9AGAR|nr:hypothetical protein DFH07DRAFT_784359 [Mycena maculata]KAJ7720596.1 hypothetical protein DFH07DRAFT_784364 [Mycena maculata]
MGVVAYHKLIQLKCKVNDFKIAIAFHPTVVVHSFGCMDEPVCSRLWESFWWRGYSKQLLIPNNVMTPAAILLEVNTTKGLLAHMPCTCIQNMMESIWESNPFNNEQEYVEEALKDLSEWMMTL